MSRHDRPVLSPEAERVVEAEAVPPQPDTRAAAPGPVPEVAVMPAPPAPKKAGPKRALLAVAAIAVLGGAGYFAEQYWTTGRFMIETDDAYIDADISLVSSRVQGYVAEVTVEANAHVTAGQVLVRLDDGDYRIAVQTAESRYATAGSTLMRIDAQTDAARAAVTQAEAGRDAADAQLRTATAAGTRTQSLAKGGIVAQAQLDEATEALDTATASVATARAAVASAEAQVAVLRAQRAEAEGQRNELALAVDQARRDLDMTVLRAPADGVLANLTLETGDLVAPGARLAAVVPDAGLFIEANFKETQLAGLAPGATATVTFDALPDATFEGTVASVAPATGAVFSLLPADNATGNFTKVVQRVPVRIALPADAVASGALRAGLSAIVEIDSRTMPQDATQTAARATVE